MRSPGDFDDEDESRTRERMTNYRIFPKRGNASMRIFGSNSPERITRKEDQNILPIILGGRLKTTR
jgi:hypothetical protein